MDEPVATCNLRYFRGNRPESKREFLLGLRTIQLIVSVSRKYILWRKTPRALFSDDPVPVPAVFLSGPIFQGAEALDAKQFPLSTQLAIRRYLAASGLGAEIVLTSDDDRPLLSVATLVTIEDMDLSVRSNNCLNAVSIKTIDDLLNWTAPQLMALPHFGRKCLEEITGMLGQMGYTLPDHWPERRPTLVEQDPCSGIAPLACLLIVEELVGDKEVVGSLKSCGWNALADLSAHRIDAIRSLARLNGAGTELLENSLKALNVELPFELPRWVEENIGTLRNAFSDEINKLSESLHSGTSVALNLTSARSLYEEMEKLIPEGYSPPKRDAVALVFGFGEREAMTLEAVARAQTPPVTREWVRQIALPVTKALREQGSRLPWLSLAVNRLRQLAPCAAVDAEKVLLDEGITGQRFRVENILLLARRAHLELDLLLDGDFLRTNASSALFVETMRTAAKLSSRWGLADWQELLNLIPGLEGSDIRGQLTEALWLDPERRYFVFPKRENSLSNRLARMLAVTPNLGLAEAYRGIFRDIRMESSRLPERLFEEFCKVWPWCKAENGLLYAGRDLPPAEASGDDLLVLLLREAGSPLRRRDIVALALKQGISEAIITQALTYSNVIAAHDGYFAVIGDSKLYSEKGEHLEEINSGMTQVAQISNESTEENESILPEHADPKSFIEGVLLAVLRRVNDLKLELPWSVAELRLNSNDRVRLLEWGHCAAWDFRRDGGNYRLRTGESVRKRTALGLTFLLFAAEVDREFAGLDSIWPAIEGALGHQQRGMFMVRPGIPKVGLREALEAACRQFGIRHGFEDSGQQVFWRTVGLQYGLRRSHLSNLARLLSEPVTLQPVVLQLLLEPRSANSSSSFQDTWKLLRDIQQGRLPETDPAAAFAKNPWLRCFRLAELISCLRQPASRHRQPQGGESEQKPDAYAYFIDPQLRWEANEAFLEYSLNPHAPAWVDVESMNLLCEDPFRRERVFIESGAWSLSGGPLRVPLTQRAHSGFHFKFMLGRDAVCTETQEEVICKERPFTLFRASGPMLSPIGESSLKEDLFLMSAIDLRICGLPAGCAYRLVLRGMARLTRVPQSAIQDLCLFDPAGVELWTGIRHNFLQVGTQQLTAEVGGARWGEKARLILPVLDFFPDRLRLNNGSVCKIAGARGGWTIERTPSLGRAHNAQLLGLNGAHQRSATVTLSHQAYEFGAAIEINGQWLPLDGSKILDAGLLRTSRVLARTGPSIGQEFCWTEGKRALSGLRSYGGALLNVYGVGEPLRISDGVYNRPEAALNVARALTNEGYLRAVQQEVRGGWTAMLPFDSPLEEDHHLWMWAQDAAAPVEVPRSLLSQEGFTLRWVAPTNAKVFGWALAFAGERVGAVCTANSLREFSAHLGQQNWADTAAWVRWWHIPVLHADIRQTIEIRVRRYPVETLKAWTLPVPDGGNLIFDELQEEAWATAARELLWGWEPSTAEAVDLAKALSIWTGVIEKDAAERSSAAEPGLLARVSPVLLAKITSVALPAMYPFPKNDLAVLVGRLLQAVDENALRDGFSVKDMCERYALGENRIDGEFVLKSIVGAARAEMRGENVDWHNLQVAFHQPGLREIVTIALLTDLREDWRNEVGEK